MISQNPNFARSALSRYTPQDFIDLIEKHKITWHEKKLGQLFCDDSAQQIIDMLIAECEAVKVELHYNVTVRLVSHSDHFIVVTDEGDLHARYLGLPRCPLRHSRDGRIHPGLGS